MSAPPRSSKQRRWSFAKFQFPSTKSADTKQGDSDLPPGLQKTKTMHEQQTSPKPASPSEPGPSTARRLSTTSLDPMDRSATDDASPSTGATNSTLPAAYQHLQHLPNAQPEQDTLPPLPLDRKLTRSETKAARRESRLASQAARRASKAQEKQARRASELAEHEADRARGDVLDWEWHNRKCGCEKFEPRTGGSCAYARGKLDRHQSAVAPLIL